MKEIVKKIIKGNNKFSKKTPNKKFKHIVKSQTPKITLVMCSDSRYNHKLFGFEPTNQIFTIENIGNQIKTAEGSVEYGVLHLKTPVLLILGHTGCGAIKASLGNYSKETKAIKKELRELKTIRDKKWFNDISVDIKETKYAEYNVDCQINLGIEKFKNLVDNGDLIIIGAMYDFHNMYGFNKGGLYITNVNGETDAEKVKKMGILEELSDEVREIRIKRLG